MALQRILESLGSKALSPLDGQGDNILHLAAEKGSLNVCQYLLSKNVLSINAKGLYNRTPLHYAAAKGHTAVAKYLLLRGAGVALTDSDGSTPLDLASSDDMITLLWDAAPEE